MHQIIYRKATAEDVMLVFGWSNEKQTRANSFSSQTIDIESHKKWFGQKLLDHESLILISEYDRQPAGLIRYDTSKSGAVVGVMVDSSFRGKGLAALFLKDTGIHFLRKYRVPIEAYIKSTNIASVKAFEKAGYKLTEEKEVQGYASYIYRLTEEDV
jgi:UDP-2,4-diacetamido-2,4,6-trideoxy-beta-L-altropyranose hydrolase